MVGIDGFEFVSTKRVRQFYSRYRDDLVLLWHGGHSLDSGDDGDFVFGTLAAVDNCNPQFSHVEVIVADRALPRRYSVSKITSK